jgi:hypothetical protein
MSTILFYAKLLIKLGARTFLLRADTACTKYGQAQVTVVRLGRCHVTEGAPTQRLADLTGVKRSQQHQIPHLTTIRTSRLVMTMTSLLVLPDELFLEVFEQSNSIDDCLRFGRCCRRLYGLLDRNRLQIMRCIIVSDLPLTRMRRTAYDVGIHCVLH